MLQVPIGAEPAGYAWFITKFDLPVPPRVRLSFTAEKQSRLRVDTLEGRTRTIYPLSYRAEESIVDQLEFALKYDGIDLEVLARLFEQRVGAKELERWIRAKPTSQYARRAWFLFEWLTGARLRIPDAKTGNYVDLLDSTEHYTCSPVRSRRHRVNDNLLGNRSFCPMIRRTETLAQFEEKKLDEQAARMVGAYDPEVLRKAVNYLYSKETRSSFKIEDEIPDTRREARFVELLSRLGELSALDEYELTRLQNAIVLPGAEDDGFRNEPVYIGEQLDLVRQYIHYIAPKAGDVQDLMGGWRTCLERMGASGVPAIVQATAISFGFVFIHPFTDGNGRIHRLLIHLCLARARFTPNDVVLPVSAVILKHRAEYDAALESISRPLMKWIDYEELDDGRIEILGSF